MRSLRSLRLVLAAALAALAGLTLPAAAAAAECAVVKTTQPYLWAGDAGWYFTAPGGTFQPGGTPWTPTGSAAPVAESWRSAGNVVLQVPSASTATSPAFCVDAYRPHLRLDVRAIGRYGSLRIEALRAGRAPVVLATLSASTAPVWTLSPRVPLSVPLGIPAGSSESVRLRLTGVGTTWRADDVAIDPYRR